MTVNCAVCSHSLFTATTITEGPVSLTALVGTNAQFHCAGTGNYLVWEVDGLVFDHPNILARGITTVTLPSSGTVQSNLTVPATSENNGTTVRCVVQSLSSTPVISSNATLTILPGELKPKSIEDYSDFFSIHFANKNDYASWAETRGIR